MSRADFKVIHLCSKCSRGRRNLEGASSQHSAAIAKEVKTEILLHR